MLVYLLLAASLLSAVAPLFVIAQEADSFQIVGETGVSAQMMFFGGHGKIIIIDKTENNSIQVNGHPAWAVEYNLANNSLRPLDVISNTFCAGGSHLANGSFVHVGGNPEVDGWGVAGGRSVRIFTPCDDEHCEFTDDVSAMPLPRWYPTVETLETGDVIIIGGELEGSFVNTPEAGRNVPTYEYWPQRGEPKQLDFLLRTMPANLYPLTWLLPSRLLFMQAGWEAILLDHATGAETKLPNIPHAQRTYPSSAASAMLPMTVANNFSITILMCGGFNPPRDDWNQNLIQFTTYGASDSCVSIQPLADSPAWTDEDTLPEPRSIGSFIILPDGRLLIIEGAGYGVSGYGWDAWAVGQSYATSPVYRPAYYNPAKPRGSRISPAPTSSSIARMYHSTATLLPDGSVFLAGSNPNVDVITSQNNASYPYKTEYRSEKFFPSYFASTRPQPSGVPATITYGGSPSSITLPASSVPEHGQFDQVIRVALIRTGFQTHGIGMGQRYIQLVHTHTLHADGSVTLHVSPLPPNPALFAPGPALVFVVVDGIPSIGVEVMVGNGELGTQPTQAIVDLPPSSIEDNDIESVR